MLVTIINAISVIVGALVGLLMKKHVSDKFQSVVMTSAGVVTLILGIEMAMADLSVLALLFSLILGGFIGSALKLEERIEGIGNKFAREGEDSSFGKGFLNSSILFCSGAMSIVGSINAGTTGDSSLILIKSVMDGFMAVVFAATYGRGVLLSSVAILIYQGFFVLAGSFISPLLGEAGIAYIAASGGFLLIMLALGLLGIKEIKTAYFLPSLALSPLLGYLFGLLPF
jgi:uncharacterized membrane protein YqgA involved in biofilm formation